MRRWRQLKGLDRQLRDLDRGLRKNPDRRKGAATTSTALSPHNAGIAPPSLRAPPLPKLPGSLFSASLDPSFLQTRAKCLAAYVTSAASRYSLSLSGARGPAPLLAFLAPSDAASAASSSSASTSVHPPASALPPATPARAIATSATSAARLAPPTPLLASPPRALAAWPTAPNDNSAGGQADDAAFLRRRPKDKTTRSARAPPAVASDGASAAVRTDALAEEVEGGTRLPSGALMSRLLLAAAPRPCPAEQDAAALQARREVRRALGRGF